ncbi:MAG: potassium channel family protein [Solirubrobacterales bacterium]
MEGDKRVKKLRHSAALELTGGTEPDNGVVGSRAIRAQKLMNTPLMIAAALTLPAVVLSETRESGTLAELAVILNWGTWLAFLFQLVVMLVLVPDRLKYLKHHPVDVVIVVLTPPVLPASLQALRMIRLLRLLRLLRLTQISKSVFSAQGLAYASLMTLVISLIGGTAFRAFEASNQNLSEWDSVYWAIATMTTLGSQFESTTTGSEIVEILILLTGVTFISMLTGAIANRFLNPGSPKAEPSAGEEPE